MLSLHEAIQRCGVYNVGFRVYGSLQYQVFYREDRNHQESRLVDWDLDDVVLTASRMRKERNELQSGDRVW